MQNAGASSHEADENAPGGLGGLQATRIYRQKGSADVLLGEIEQIRSLDAQMEARIKTMGKWIGLFWLLTLAAGILTLALHDTRFAAALAVTLTVAIVLHIVKSRMARFDFENRRYELTSHVLGLVRGDLDPHAPMSLVLDLRPATDASKLVGKGQFGRWKAQLYRDDWLHLAGALLDGTRFALVMSERKQARSCWARSASGKTKHKTKSKSKTVAMLGLAVKASKHAALDRIVKEAAPAIQLPSYARALGLTGKAGAMRLKVGLDDEWSEAEETGQAGPCASRAVAMMFLSLYNVAALSRKVSKTATATA